MASLAPLLALGAVTSPLKRRISPGAQLPAAGSTGPDVRIDHGHLAAYARLCGFTGTDPLPLTYPHVIAFPLALRVMTRRDFPLPLLGLIHTGVTITQHRALHPDDRPELTVHADRLVPHRRGTEVHMVSRARLAGDLVWESRSTYLARHTTGERPPTAPDSHRATPGQLPAVADWDLPGDLGRRYGAVSGDRNPVHLYAATARLFGFPRPIAHGMWTFARCVAQAGPAEAVHVQAEFKAPVPLPSTV
ncbi:MAG TPA: MaoC/PaaZ C-terminal domain-containing protein, partial [Streptomyces sp.]|nr:MaoC/PaaZ C-terminal domain-containing protein [Streptomyces sp.]